jgi:hypothetical protein
LELKINDVAAPGDIDEKARLADGTRRDRLSSSPVPPLPQSASTAKPLPLRPRGTKGNGLLAIGHFARSSVNFSL